MIPGADFLEQHYADDEVRALLELKKLLERESNEKSRAKEGRRLLRALWDDELEWIQKTHFIRTKQGGQLRLLKLNYAQQAFYDQVIVRCRKERRPIRGICLKARQLGMSTFIQLWQYEQCDRLSNRGSLTISYDDESSKSLFSKSLIVHNNLWFRRDTSEKGKGKITFADNGSFFHVRTAGNLAAGRGETYQHLHASESPMWVDAGETQNSASQAIPSAPGTSIFYESTAKGAVGQFYDDWNDAEAGRSDFIPFFAPWFWDPDYSLAFASDSARLDFERELNLTERRLVEDHGVTLEQLHWRRFTIRNSCQNSEAKFRQEYPSTASEAFLTTGSPVFNAEAVARLEKLARPALWRGTVALELNK